MLIKSKTESVSFEEYAGDTLVMAFLYEDNTGTPVDLTGYSAEFQVLKHVNSTTTLISGTNPSRVVFGETPTANIIVRISESETRDTLGEGYFYYRLRLTDTGGNRNTIATGNIRIII